MGAALQVSEIFFSIQGETTRTGIPTVFVRLAGCNIRCRYCDTTYAYDKGREMEIGEIIDRVASFKCVTVEITGGEPMLQEHTPELAEKLMEAGYTVMIETNGTVNLASLPGKVIRLVDIKCPDSKSEGTFLYENLALLTEKDELKFVVSSKNDFDWALAEIENRSLLSICPVNVSPAAGFVEAGDVAGWILASGKNVRLNLQVHKYLGLR